MFVVIAIWGVVYVCKWVVDLIWCDTSDGKKTNLFGYITTMNLLATIIDFLLLLLFVLFVLVFFHPCDTKICDHNTLNTIFICLNNLWSSDKFHLNLKIMTNRWVFHAIEHKSFYLRRVQGIWTKFQEKKTKMKLFIKECMHVWHFTTHKEIDQK